MYIILNRTNNLLSFEGKNGMPYKSNRIGIWPVNRFLVFNMEALHTYPFYLCQSGSTEQCRDLYCRRTDTGFWSLEYVRKGELFYSDETESFSLREGDFFLLKPTGANLLRCVSAHAVKYCLGFHGRMLIPLLENMRIGAPGRKHFRSESHELAEKLQQEAAELFSGNTDEQREKNVLFSLKVMMMVGRAIKEREMPDNLLRMLDYISSHPGQRIDLETLASLSGTTVITVIRLFSAHLGTTPGEYIRRKRLESAAELLKMPEYSVKEIAARLGYASPQYLATDFKKRYGVTPREFQKKPGNAQRS